MTTYRLYGTAIRSFAPFPELPRGTAAGAWRFDRGPLVSPATTSWSRLWTLADGSPWLTVARVDRAWHFLFADTAEYLADPADRAIRNCMDDGPDSTVRHLLIDQVLPLLLSLDRVVLHASAVAVDGRAVAFIAPGGGGKSTLALHLARRGLPVLADDALVVEDEDRVPRVHPSYPGLRLWPDTLTDAERWAGLPLAHYTEKKRLVGGVPFHDRALPLEAIYVIERDGSNVDVRPLRPAQLLAMLLSQAFRLDRRDRPAHAAHFDRLAALSRCVRGWVLRVPDDLRAASTAADAVLAHAGHAQRVVQ